MDERPPSSGPTARSQLRRRLLIALEDSARLDSVSRVVLALLFVCFSLGYAGYYTLL